MTVFPRQFLPWVGNLDEPQMLGLFNNSLYEVLQDINVWSGEAEVSAIGFNITCGYLPAEINALSDLNVTLGSVGTVTPLLGGMSSIKS